MALVAFKTNIATKIKENRLLDAFTEILKARTFFPEDIDLFEKEIQIAYRIKRHDLLYPLFSITLRFLTGLWRCYLFFLNGFYY